MPAKEHLVFPKDFWRCSTCDINTEDKCGECQELRAIIRGCLVTGTSKGPNSNGITIVVPLKLTKEKDA